MTEQRPKAGKIIELTTVSYKATNIKQIFSDYGENFVLTVNNREYFANKRIYTAISAYAKSKKRIPTLLTFSIMPSKSFNSEDGNTITYANVQDICIF